MFKEFMNKYLGQAVDVDGRYGAQCFDLFNAWNRDYNGCTLSGAPSGYAKSLAENKVNNGILNYFTETTVDNMIEGTVVVYGECAIAPLSHVCFFIEDNGNGTFKALQQNYNKKQYVTIDNMPYSGIIGAFIPNQILAERQEQKKPIEEPLPVEQPNTNVQYVNLPPINEEDIPITSWRVYPLNKTAQYGSDFDNSIGRLNPYKFGGISYELKGYTEWNTPIIETRDFGTVHLALVGIGTITDVPQFEVYRKA